MTRVDEDVILSITPNPSLDLGGVVNELVPNEKSYVHDDTKAPGGNAINSARILRRLNVPVVVTGFLGGNIGNEIKSLLDLENVANEFVQIAESSRVNVTVSNFADHRQTRLSFSGPRVTKGEELRLRDMIEKRRKISMVVVGGSLPKGIQPKDLLRWMKLAAKRKLNCVVDCPGSILRELLPGSPLLIKPNLTEFQELTGSPASSVSQVMRAANKLKSYVQYICVSSVEDGALLVSPEGDYFGRVPKIKIRSTVGAGDSMVGAMVAQFHRQNYSGDEILRWGLAAAASTLERKGTTLGDSASIRKHFHQIKVTKLT